MSKYRQNKINQSVVEAMAIAIRTVKDPRVRNGIVTINAADVTADLKFAKIFFGCIGCDPAEVSKGLKSATGYLRGALAKELNLRITPELTFIHDTSAEQGAHISTLLKNLDISKEDADDENDHA
ncbi:MAG TPA: 30S ribosome-binding factor RbfA [Clostridiales bacterium]|jgi:ribosome-binding factor A|nr:30S ribosome-binding factor RbfA [Clostridiales bacterium]HBE13919.1 30S ribosome-binding factor RbfA [Clostridiales bacterium]HCG36402.1 30S ribosome-binding factor RbfA [Clostridiales bacterium]